MCLNFKKSKKIKIQSYIGVRMVNNIYFCAKVYISAKWRDLHVLIQFICTLYMYT